MEKKNDTIMHTHKMMINTQHAPHPCGPYVQAIKTKNLVFVSGQIGICPDTKLISHTIYQQTHQALKNIKNIIEESNLTIENIIKTTIFVTNINDLPEINKIYEKFFTSYPNSSHAFSKKTTIFPARSCVEISKLPENAKIKIEAIAIINF